MKLGSVFILVLLACLTSAVSLDLSWNGRQGGSYPMFFLDCSQVAGGCANVSMWETYCIADAPCNNYTNSFFFKVEGRETLALEQSGSPEWHTLEIETRASSEIGDGSPAAWDEFPLNLDTTDFLSSTTISLSSSTEAGRLMFSLDWLVEGSLLEIAEVLHEA